MFQLVRLRPKGVTSDLPSFALSDMSEHAKLEMKEPLKTLLSSGCPNELNTPAKAEAVPTHWIAVIAYL